MVKSYISKKLSNVSNLSLTSTPSSSSMSVTASGTDIACVAVNSTQNMNSVKNRNDPGRFFGDGVQFKAKLIGILEVGEARGDRMCQEALQDLKMAIRAAGEHKQRITIHVTIDGLRLRDEKTSDSLYHHPVHKISFIAQDMTDSRAFGYIFGSPDSGHRFFGIKTDKAASQVVLAMRDLFQVVFELKKKEIELARQQIQSKTMHDHQLTSLVTLKSLGLQSNDLSASSVGVGATNSNTATSISGFNVGSTCSTAMKAGGNETTCSSLSLLAGGAKNSGNLTSHLAVKYDGKTGAKELSPESVADLVDLELALSSIQRGISQMERITPNDQNLQQPSTATTTINSNKSYNEEDPFGDSFINFPTYNLLPPPESSRSRNKLNKSNETMTALHYLSTPISTVSGGDTSGGGGGGVSSVSPTQLQIEDDSWLQDIDSTGVSSVSTVNNRAPLATSELTPTKQLSYNAALVDVEINTINKNRPLSAIDDPLGVISSNIVEQQSSDNNKVAVAVASANVMFPHDTDPFSPTRKKSDPFQDGDIFCNLDPFEFEFTRATVSTLSQTITTTTISEINIAATVGTSSHSPSMINARTVDVFSGSLQVSLPPEMARDLTPSILVTATTKPIIITNNSIRSRPVPSLSLLASAGNSMLPLQQHTSNVVAIKQQTADVISSISNKKMPHLFGQTRFSKRSTGDTNTQINMRRLQESDSLSENETAPEPPPRPDSVMHIEPPPLPPKKQFNDIIIRPHITSSNAMPTTSTSQMLTINNINNNNNGFEKIIASFDVPPIPLPLRRVGRNNCTYPGPGRPRKPATATPIAAADTPSAVFEQHNNDYLTPMTLSQLQETRTLSGSYVAMTDVPPPLLPPPVNTSTRLRLRQQQQQYNSINKSTDIYENKLEILQQHQQQHLIPYVKETIIGNNNNILPDITLSQLLTLGIDELAIKLNVPTSKLSTMTLVELTTYLAEFLEKTNQNLYKNKNNDSGIIKEQQQNIFCVNLDQSTTFLAKFDDTFGEDLTNVNNLSTNTTTSNISDNDDKNIDFIANFEQFNDLSADHISTIQFKKQDTQQDTSTIITKRLPSVPSADRYAVFREIIDQDLQNQRQEPDDDIINKTIKEEDASKSIAKSSSSNELNISSIHFNVIFDKLSNKVNDDYDGEFVSNINKECTHKKTPSKITEAVAQAKDRYAALRDIILVENLFETMNEINTTTRKAIINENSFSEFSNEFPSGEEIKSEIKPSKLLTSLRQQSVCAATMIEAEDNDVDLNDIDIEDDDDDIEDDEDIDVEIDNDDDDEHDREVYEEYDEPEDVESSLDSNDRDQIGTTGATATTASGDNGNAQQYEPLSTSTHQLNIEQKSPLTVGLTPGHQENFLTVNSEVGGGSILNVSKDDLEIDALMQRAISNLSLDSREHISPITSFVSNQESTSTNIKARIVEHLHYNDLRTSPITLPKTRASQIVTQLSPILTELSAVSSLIDNASNHLGNLVEAENKTTDRWTTFDTRAIADEPKSDKNRITGRESAILLSLPPAPPSNASQNDTAESPCSSDARDDIHVITSRGKMTCMPLASSSGGHNRRWRSKEHAQHHTSSSSRDLSPWNDDPLSGTDYQQPKAKCPPTTFSGSSQSMMHGTGTSNHRHSGGGYYMCHNRRMNSCDEDYDYDEEYSNRRDHRKLKQGISRSRDNFDLDSPNWFYYPSHNWLSQDVEQAAVSARLRSFDRSAYERSTYGPPIYDKRGVALALNASTGSYERRGIPGNYDKRSQKYYRDFSRTKNDFDEYNESSQKSERYRDIKGRRGNVDYENIYNDDRMTYKSSRPEFMYDRNRKSFDRDSIESFESSSRRPQRFGSGDVYGSHESRKDVRERYVVEKTRSLRKRSKLRAIGDINYEGEDSEGEYFQQQSRHQRMDLASRVLHRPNHSTSVSSGNLTSTQTRMRKSSGSSPWEGEEGSSISGQKLWKRPASATENERRLTEHRRAAALTQTPSGSDEEKERRFRKKQRVRGINKELALSTSIGSRYVNTPIAMHTMEHYDYITYQDEENNDLGYEVSPTNEKKFERLNCIHRNMQQRMPENERRGSLIPTNVVGVKGGFKKKILSGDFNDDEDYVSTQSQASPTLMQSGLGTAATITLSTKNQHTADIIGMQEFVFDGGFESDFNQSTPPSVATATGITSPSCTSTPAASATTPSSKSAFRFSNDFSEREKLNELHHAVDFTATVISPPCAFTNIESMLVGSTNSSGMGPITTPKLRFDDNVRVTQIDDAAAFEDDFSGAHFDFNNTNIIEEQWSLPPIQTSLLTTPTTTTAISSILLVTSAVSSITATATIAATTMTETPSNCSNVGNVLATKKHNIRSNKLQQRNDLIKKSESVNIFTKHVEDPFEDDEFFTSTIPTTSIAEDHKNFTETNFNSNLSSDIALSIGKQINNNIQWLEDDDGDDNTIGSNFAKFDENM